jgi:hypothetical protein
MEVLSLYPTVNTEEPLKGKPRKRRNKYNHTGTSTESVNDDTNGRTTGCGVFKKNFSCYMHM